MMYDIDYVLKIGGSMIRNRDALIDLMKKISDLSNNFNFLIIPGGGAIADVVRDLDTEYDLSSESTHWMAIKSMDINGILLSDLGDKFSTVSDLDKISFLLSDNKIPVLEVYQFLRNRDELPNSWCVTSDSIAFYIADFIAASRCVLIKDVKGLINQKGEIVKKIGIESLKEWDGDKCIDDYIVKMLEEWQINIDLSIVSGLDLDNLEKYIKGEEYTGTELLRK